MTEEQIFYKAIQAYSLDKRPFELRFLKGPRYGIMYGYFDDSSLAYNAVKDIWRKYTCYFTLQDIINTLPVYTTTGVSEKRALLKINTKDHSVLKRNFQKLFENSWKNGADGILKKYGFSSYKCILTNGTVQKTDVNDFSESGKGGLKIQFYENNSKTPSSFIWMRGSGTESVFRILCDVKGDNPEKEKELLEWETKLLLEADKMS